MAIEFAIEDRRADNGAHVVAVTGEIDLFTAPEFKQRMNQPIEDGVERLIVDLSGTTFIDSSSLGVLIEAHRRLKQRNGSLVVVTTTEPARTVAELYAREGELPALEVRRATLEEIYLALTEDDEAE